MNHVKPRIYQYPATKEDYDHKYTVQEVGEALSQVQVVENGTEADKGGGSLHDEGAGQHGVPGVVVPPVDHERYEK